MSGEFGSYYQGYFHDQMQRAAEDCADGDCEITRLWGRVLAAFGPVAYDIANAEAGDSGEYAPIITSIKQMDAIKAALWEVKNYLYPFEQVMWRAVLDETEKRVGSDAAT